MSNKIGSSTSNYSNGASKIAILVRGCQILGRGKPQYVKATNGTAFVRRSFGTVVPYRLVGSSTTASKQPIFHRWYSAGSSSSTSQGEESSGENATASPPPEDNDETVLISIEEPENGIPPSPTIPADLDRSKFTHEVKFKLPDMEGDGRVTKWFKKEGDIIQRRDILCEIELEVGINHTSNLMSYLIHFHSCNMILSCMIDFFILNDGH